MSKTVKNKLNELENCVLQPLNIGSTQFNPWDLPKPEQKLFAKALQLASMEIPFDELSEEQRTILHLAHKRLQARIFDLFTGYMVGLHGGIDDHHVKMLVHERFLWFIRELAKEVDQELEVARIEKETPPTEEVDKVDEYYRKAPKLFTVESWFKLQDELFQDIAQRPDFKKWLNAAIKRGKK